MGIKVEHTANKNIIKFVASRNLVKGSYEISNLQQAADIPLAQELMQLPFVTNVFITANFIAVQKNDSLEWDMVLEDLQEIVEDELLANPQVVLQPQQNAVSVYVEMTPNSEVMKFVANKILINGMVEAKTVEETTDIPLAEYLFSFPYVKEVFITDNFISIMKNEGFEWEGISMEIRYNLSEYLKEGKEISKIQNQTSQTLEQFPNREYTEIEKKIKDILDEYVLPAVSGDGGNIELVSFDESTKTAKMLLQGACSGCPSSTITLKNGIESLLKQLLPNEVETVEAING